MTGVTEGDSEWGRGRAGNSIDGEMSGERKSWRFLVQGGEGSSTARQFGFGFLFYPYIQKIYK
jgi:hypothetical protein